MSASAQRSVRATCKQFSNDATVRRARSQSFFARASTMPLIRYLVARYWEPCNSFASINLLDCSQARFLSISQQSAETWSEDSRATVDIRKTVN